LAGQNERKRLQVEESKKRNARKRAQRNGDFFVVSKAKNGVPKLDLDAAEDAGVVKKPNSETLNGCPQTQQVKKRPDS